MHSSHGDGDAYPMDYVVTEYGLAKLWDKNMGEPVETLIVIAV